MSRLNKNLQSKKTTKKAYVHVHPVPETIKTPRSQALHPSLLSACAASLAKHTGGKRFRVAASDSSSPAQ